MTALEGLPPGHPARVEALRARLEEHPLAAQLTARRKERMVQVAERRLRSVTVVMENLYDAHNVSAVVRTAEGFGLDAVHVVEQPHRYRRSPTIVRGADRWVHLHRHKEMQACAAALRREGFLVCAADVGAGARPIDEIPVDRPVAIVMGSEHEGLTRTAKVVADIRFWVPMCGFTESFNVSVSCSLALFDLARRRRQLQGCEGDLDYDTSERTVLAWLEKSARRGTRNRLPAMLGV
ncbi:MAG: TrmH family RNA methyltransferase [Myxococcota bacterium]